MSWDHASYAMDMDKKKVHTWTDSEARSSHMRRVSVQDDSMLGWMTDTVTLVLAPGPRTPVQGVTLTNPTRVDSSPQYNVILIEVCCKVGLQHIECSEVLDRGKK